jgi:hypothetical protein
MFTRMPMRNCRDHTQYRETHYGLYPECSDALGAKAKDQIFADEAPKRNLGGQLLFKILEVL